MGAKAFSEIMGKSKLSEEPKVVEEVDAVGRRLAEVAGRPDFKWEFKVIQDDKTINAFCLPGGKVGIYTGILPFTQDDTGLAAVVSHEIGHAIARHGAERMTTILLAQLGQVGMNIALSGSAPEALRALNIAYGLGATVGVILPYSRRQEFEADHISLVLMAKAGYDPQGALAFWERMAKAGGKEKKPPAYLSTHPTDESRMEEIRRLLPQIQGRGKSPS